MTVVISSGIGKSVLNSVVKTKSCQPLVPEMFIRTDHGRKLKTEVHDSKGKGRVGRRLSGVGRHCIQQLHFSGLRVPDTHFRLCFPVRFLLGSPLAAGPVTQRSVQVFLLPFTIPSLQFAIFLLDDGVVSTVQPVYGIRYRRPRLRYIRLTTGRHYVPCSEFIRPSEDTYSVSWDFLYNHNIHPGGREAQFGIPVCRLNGRSRMAVILSRGPDSARGTMASVFRVDQFWCLMDSLLFYYYYFDFSSIKLNWISSIVVQVWKDVQDTHMYCIGFVIIIIIFYWSKTIRHFTIFYWVSSYFGKFSFKSKFSIVAFTSDDDL